MNKLFKKKKKAYSLIILMTKLQFKPLHQQKTKIFQHQRIVVVIKLITFLKIKKISKLNKMINIIKNQNLTLNNRILYL